MNQLADALIALDLALTGAEEAFSRNQHARFDYQRWAEGGYEFYLSDGGYSRVCRDTWTGNVFLTSNSTNRVRAKWAACAELIDAVAKAACDLWPTDNL